ncbi:MAG: T9SS type A sorting domain-containing protein [Flavisolibacter sp.]
MKKHLFRIVMLLNLLTLATVSFSQINNQDSLALVDLYNGTGGPAWINNTNWLTAAPVSNWFGVTVENQRVTSVMLTYNNLKGNLSSSIGNLTAIKSLNLSANLISGTIPASVGNFSKLQVLALGDNQLSGAIPSTLNNVFSTGSFVSIALKLNRFTFAGMDIFNSYINNVQASYDTQMDIPLIQNGNILSVDAGAPKANNLYKWYKDTTLIATKTGDSTLTISSPGNYSVIVNRGTAPYLSLRSIMYVSSQDSLALVDFYNSTNGASWINNTNWLTAAPVTTWYGVYADMGRVRWISLNSNNLTGNLPSSLSQLTALTSLEIETNKLTGSIPSSLGQISSLLAIRLVEDGLTGGIPSELGNLPNLFQLTLISNKLSGAIPSSLANLKNLTSLSFSDNQLSGTLPPELGDLTNLIFLDFSKNQFSGTLPLSFGNLSHLRTLNVGNNQFIGTLPNFLYRLPHLSEIDFDHNSFSGIIPDSICYVPSMAYLRLNDNQLTGKIPDSIGKLSPLFVLALENNQLEGKIPSSIIRQSMSKITLQNNHFTFDGLELPPLGPSQSMTYAPQSLIPLHRTGNLLSVTTGGTLTNNTYRLYKDGILNQTKTGDSTFTITDIGDYYITANNSIATQLTLSTNISSIVMRLAEKYTFVTTSISGSTPVDVNDGIYKLVRLTPTAGANSLNGSVTSSITLDSSVRSYNNAPYVQRHYDITPANNDATSQATVTLFFTQGDFDNFNTYVTSNNLAIPLLPSGGVDNGNVRIIQYHGQFNGSSDPANYNGGSVTIVPNVIWDASNSWWEVSFPVSGFSGFYLTSQNIILPMSLTSFVGKWDNRIVSLHWSTVNEVNTSHFEVERNNTGLGFTQIATVQALSTRRDNNYDFSDRNPLHGRNDYRLKVVDLNGQFVYSPIISVKTGESTNLVSVYPNPIQRTTKLQFTVTAISSYSIKITDANGKEMKQVSGISTIGKNEVELDFSRYAKGTYFILFEGPLFGKQIIKVSKQ